MFDVGVYFHLPFCERVCPYCDFAVVAGRPGKREARTLAALTAELDARAPEFPDAQLASVYFGGGTPSLFAPANIARLLARARQHFCGAPREVTLELNPSTTERAWLSAFADAGVTRLSIGVQSFDDAVLQKLGRAHAAQECHETLKAVRAAGFARWSLDLICGVPGQTLASVRADADAALEHGAAHVSCYALSAPPATKFGRAVARGRMHLPEPDAVADMLLALAEIFERAGLSRYELSNYARAGHEAQHNARYWRREPVLGVGPGAHSYAPPALAKPAGARAANERDFERWCARVLRGNARPPERGVLSRSEARFEAAFLSLRTREGLLAHDFAREFGAAPRAFFAAAIERARAAGTLRENARGDLALTRRGWLLADAVFAEFA